jgi:hypothetical protein
MGIFLIYYYEKKTPVLNLSLFNFLFTANPQRINSLKTEDLRVGYRVGIFQ